MPPEPAYAGPSAVWECGWCGRGFSTGVLGGWAEFRGPDRPEPFPALQKEGV
jgi:hypothetical protein